MKFNIKIFCEQKKKTKNFCLNFKNKKALNSPKQTKDIQHEKCQNSFEGICALLLLSLIDFLFFFHPGLISLPFYFHHSATKQMAATACDFPNCMLGLNRIALKLLEPDPRCFHLLGLLCKPESSLCEKTFKIGLQLSDFFSDKLAGCKGISDSEAFDPLIKSWSFFVPKSQHWLAFNGLCLKESKEKVKHDEDKIMIRMENLPFTCK